MVFVFMLSPLVHFMSGLPRSGSTLLAAILRQNPVVAEAGYISPVAPMIVKLTSVMVEGEYQTEFDTKTRDRVLQGVLLNYYGKLSAPEGQQPMIIDNSRIWCTRLGLANALFPGSKVICCVRDPVWIIDSFERLIQRNPLLGSKIVPIERRGNLYSRIDYILGADGPFGFCWRAFNEAYHGDMAHNLIVVDYDRLVNDPAGTMTTLTDALQLPAWRYDFERVQFEEPVAFDQNLNSPGQHIVRERVGAIPRRLSIPPEIASRLAGGTFWRDSRKNPGGATIIA
ncbi:sulfotransferase [Komagataeibacter intermedius AF2]|uniref:Sulfotransferase n=2 Tax=Komagataeibacter intermedius TaxID=66229 RepID=A0A0N1F6M6_9PROT|nr:sulfotransferase [Komagataeibacter intermedius AF2]